MLSLDPLAQVVLAGRLRLLEQFFHALLGLFEFFLVRVAGKTEADMSKLPAEREGIVTALKAKKSRERQELFEDGLVTQLIKDGKIKKNEDAIKKLAASYRG